VTKNNFPAFDILPLVADMIENVRIRNPDFVFRNYPGIFHFDDAVGALLHDSAGHYFSTLILPNSFLRAVSGGNDFHDAELSRQIRPAAGITVSDRTSPASTRFRE
jgi:hypothetical protein